MLENILSILPQSTATADVALILYIVGFQLVEIRNGYPIKDGSFVSKENTLLLLVIGGFLSLFFIWPILESFFHNILIQNVNLCIPSLLILGGIAILQFDLKMKWNFKKYGVNAIVAGVFLLILFELF